MVNNNTCSQSYMCLINQTWRTFMNFHSSLLFSHVWRYSSAAGPAVPALSRFSCLILCFSAFFCLLFSLFFSLIAFLMGSSSSSSITSDIFSNTASFSGFGFAKILSPSFNTGPFRTCFSFFQSVFSVPDSVICFCSIFVPVLSVRWRETNAETMKYQMWPSSDKWPYLNSYIK